uniref:Uncharacterized protein n=1 Tax=Anopheles albimanus TaxID=7167 RepID=A0A182FCE1_ANOAL
MEEQIVILRPFCTEFSIRIRMMLRQIVNALKTKRVQPLQVSLVTLALVFRSLVVLTIDAKTEPFDHLFTSVAMQLKTVIERE